MRKMLFLLLWLMTIGVSAKEYNYKTVAGDATQTRIYTLENGLKVYLSVNKEKPRITAYIAVGTGSKNDPAETTGLAHYLEHLMFKGTQKYGTTNYAAEKPLLDEIERRYEHYRTLTDAEERRQAYHEIDSLSQVAAQWFIPNEYDKLMSQIGAVGTNAYTSFDETVYVEDIPANEIDNWARIQADRFKEMVIRGFHTELEAVYEEYNINLNRDQNKIWNSMFAKLFPTHTYGTQTTIGTQEHLKNPSITNIKNYFKKYYCPNNVAICMAGDMDMDKTIEIIDKYFGDWKENKELRKPVLPAVPALTQPCDTTVVGQEAEMIWMGWKTDGGASMQCDTLQVLDYLLTNGKAGLVDLDLNNQMKVLTAGTGLETLADHGVYLAYGMPNEGQTLDEVKDLLLGEIEKVKRGEFSEELMKAVINNKRLSAMTQLESNNARVNKMVNAFIQGRRWEDVATDIDRQAKLTKEDVVKFANRFFKDNYVVVYKRQGVDSLQKKIDKPTITPIPTNRDLMSDFVKEVQQTKVEEIQPQFVDFGRDMTMAQTKNKQRVLYKQNTENDRFQLVLRHEFGEEYDKRLPIAASYLDYIGTDRLSAPEVQQEFYRLACTMSVEVGNDATNIVLSGLNDNLAEALRLMHNVMTKAKADQESWNMYVEQILKSRADAKANQESNVSALFAYALYGEHNSQRNQMTAEELRKADPQQIVGLMSKFGDYGYTLMYYGPTPVKELCSIVAKNYPTAKKPMAAPKGEQYMEQATPQTEILIAPYDAKNIYMRAIHNEQRQWNPEEAAVQSLFNEYFGGGMNTIVFQEMREARGLAYNAWANYYEPYRKGHPEYWMTHIITQNDKMVDCITHFNEIIDDMPASDTAFGIAKESLKKRLASMRITKMGVLNTFINNERRGIGYDLNEKIYNGVEKLTLQDILKFEKETMARKPLRYLILGDEKELDMNFLNNLAPIKRLTTEEIFGY